MGPSGASGVPAGSPRLAGPAAHVLRAAVARPEQFALRALCWRQASRRRAEDLTSMRAHVELSREGEFAVATLIQPERRNALSEACLAELRDVLEEVAAGPARGLIVAARGPVFSAGHDFRDMDGRDLEGMRRLLGLCARVMTRIGSLPQVVIAQVEGLATAAGCQLVASCDLAVAGESSRFQVPGGAGGWFCTTPGVALARAVSRKHALEMLLTEIGRASCRGRV